MKRAQFEGGPGGPSGGGYHPGGPHQGGASKRPRGDKFEVRVLVPSKVAGSVIGKGGSNIQKLRSENSASVRIPDCPGPERVMTILTDDEESAVNTLAMSLPFMTEEAVRGGPGAGSGNLDGPMELRLLIHQSIVGGIIGRAGFKIKEIREASGANIKVYQNCAPQSTDRCVAVVGTQEKLVGALKEVFKVVTATEVKGADQPYDPINFDAFYAGEYGGYGTEVDLYASGGSGGNAPAPFSGGRGGRGGMNAGGRGMPGGNRGGRGGYDQGFGGFRGGRGGGGQGFNGGFNRGGGQGFGRGGGFGGHGGRGGGQGFGGGDGNFYPSDEFGGGGGDPNFGGQRNNFGVMDGGNNFGGGGGGGGNFGGQGQFNAGGDAGGEMEASETQKVTIPKDMAGAIIGPGGSRIRKIRNDSKATIEIDEAAPGSTERIITITGSKRQIQMAQYLLQQSVRENSGPSGGPQAHMQGGGGGGGGGMPGYNGMQRY